jgi:hypothetical protein
MLKRLISVILLVALIGSSFSRFFVYAGFELNRQYIASNLCVNKSRPWMHCNGRCFLMKKVKEAEDNEKKQERTSQQTRYQDALPPLSALSIPSFHLENLKTVYPTHATPRIIHQSYEILLPPEVV